MENNKNKKSVKFQGDVLNFCDFIQVFVFTRNHHLNDACSHLLIHAQLFRERERERGGGKHITIVSVTCEKLKEQKKCMY